MPLAWPSMRSIAKYVLPVLVGPSTAVTRVCAALTVIAPGVTRGGRRGKARDNRTRRRLTIFPLCPIYRLSADLSSSLRAL